MAPDLLCNDLIFEDVFRKTPLIFLLVFSAIWGQIWDNTLKKFKTVFSLVPVNLLKPTGHVMHQQFNIQQLYALPTLYLCVLYLSENKQRLVPLTA